MTSSNLRSRFRRGEIAILLIALIGFAVPGFAGQTPAVTGDWTGTLTAGEQRLRIVLHVASSDTGALQVSADSVDQGAFGLEGVDAVMNGAHFRFVIPSVRGRYEGTLSADGETLTGTWTQTAPLPLDFVRIGATHGFLPYAAVALAVIAAFVALWFFEEKIVRTVRAWPVLPVYVAVAPLLLTCVLMAAGYLYEKSGEARDAQKYPPLGKLVDVGGHKLQLYCIGSGAPTVIIETGMGTPSYLWVPVQNGVANFTRVCTYDRAGYGWSELSPRPLSMADRVAELHTLLANAHVDGPYVLVGHSYGGALVRLYAHDCPDRVAGMVLVDAAEESFATEPSIAEFRRAYVQTLKTRTRESQFGIVRFGLRKGDPLTEAAFSSPRYWAETHDEARSILAMPEQMAGLEQPGTLGNLPLIVIRRGESTNEKIPGISSQEIDQKWQEAQTLLSKLSANSDLVVATSSGHNIEMSQPDLIVSEISRVVQSVRHNVPLNASSGGSGHCCAR